MLAQADEIWIDGDMRRDIAARGFAWIPRAAWSIDGAYRAHWRRLVRCWDDLEVDGYLKDGATFRRRRYGRFSWEPDRDALVPLPHEAYFQPEGENAYAGGIARAFAPLRPATIENPFLAALVRRTFACLPLRGELRWRPWEVRVHQVRIVATAREPGQPAPEGIHQDGTDFLTLHLVRRVGVTGGKTTIYGLDRRPIRSVTMRRPLDSLVLEDPRILHGVTPVYPGRGRSEGIRDLLGIDFIASGDAPGSSTQPGR